MKAFLFLALAPALAFAAAPAGAQASGSGRPCQITWSNPDSSRSFSLKTASGKYTTWVGGGVRARCRGTNMIVTSDSMEYSEDAHIMTLVGHAHYQEDSTVIDANSIRYTEMDQQVQALGNVRMRTRTGTTLTASQVNHFRPQAPSRKFAISDSFGRTHLVMRDSVRMPDSATTIIDADHIHMERDSIFNAGGRVVITRPDLIAKADSSESNTGKHTARLVGGSPRIDGRGGKKFSVEGRIIDVFGEAKKVDSVHARGRAVAVSDSLELRADTLHMQTKGTLIDRVLAWGPGRARATSPDRDIFASRIDISMPGQRIRELVATGQARAETKPDSLVRSTERDWIEGDTLHAFFEQTAARDTSKQPPLHELKSRGNAKSFYQVPPKEKTDTVPTVNYVSGDRIDVAFKSGEVSDVRVSGNVRGLNLAPVSKDSTAVKKPATPPKGGQR
jgi:hypothetical protein